MLADKLSDLLDDALDDLEACEQVPEVYEVDMGHWHTPLNNKKCAVCLAGATIAGRLNFNIETFVPSWLNDFPSDYKLRAINSLRKGNVGLAVYYMTSVEDRPYPAPHALNRPIVPYSKKNRTKFHRQLRQLAEDLREEGL